MLMQKNASFREVVDRLGRLRGKEIRVGIMTGGVEKPVGLCSLDRVIVGGLDGVKYFDGKEAVEPKPRLILISRSEEVVGEILIDKDELTAFADFDRSGLALEFGQTTLRIWDESQIAVDDRESSLVVFPDF